MSSTSLADNEHVATMHRADAPVGRTARFDMRKLFDSLPLLGKRIFLTATSGRSKSSSPARKPNQTPW